MVLNGQDHRVGGVDEGTLLDCNENLSEADLAGESVTVVDDGTPIVSIPAVQLHTATAREEDLPVELHGGLALQLVAGQVGVVTGGDVVVRQRAVHLRLLKVVSPRRSVLQIHHVASKTFETEQMSCFEVRMRFMAINQVLCFFQRQYLTLVMGEEMEEGFWRYDHVFTGIQTWRLY